MSAYRRLWPLLGAVVIAIAAIAGYQGRRARSQAGAHAAPQIAGRERIATRSSQHAQVASRRAPHARRDESIAGLAAQAAGGAGQVASAPSWEDAVERFEREAADEAWTHNVTSYFRAALAADAGRSMLRDVECRETLCRIELGAERPELLESGEQALRADGQHVYYRMQPGADGSAAITAFMLREAGEGLP